jgi:hypothetical protein
MRKREWLAHRALRAAIDLLNEPKNTRKLAAMGSAIDALCPDCEHAILYCRCFESVDPAIASSKA